MDCSIEVENDLPRLVLLATSPNEATHCNISDDRLQHPQSGSLQITSRSGRFPVPTSTRCHQVCYLFVTLCGVNPDGWLQLIRGKVCTRPFSRHARGYGRRHPSTNHLTPFSRQIWGIFFHSAPDEHGKFYLDTGTRRRCERLTW